MTKTDQLSFKELSAATLVPPMINTRPGSVYSDRKRNYNMVRGGDVTPGGRIWASWVSGMDGPDGYLVAATSDDGGNTWSNPRVVIDPPDHPTGLTVFSACGNMWTDPNGSLWFFFDQAFEYFDGRAGVWHIRCDNPDADAPTWTEPQRFAHGKALCRPIALRNGHWILPVSLWQRKYIKPKVRLVEPHPFTEIDEQRGLNFYATEDQGKTWHFRGRVEFPLPQFDEASLVEKDDGSIWVSARTELGISESFSSDGGRTWSEPEQCNFANMSEPRQGYFQGSKHAMRRLKSGTVVLVKHGEDIDRAPSRRTHLTAFLSRDEGKTWEGGLLLEERVERPCTYPDIFEFSDGTVGIFYDYGRDDPSEIILAKVREEDILARRLIAPSSRLGLLVSRAHGPR